MLSDMKLRNLVTSFCGEAYHSVKMLWCGQFA